MSLKNIADFCGFVILGVAVAAGFVSCSASRPAVVNDKGSRFAPPAKVGMIQSPDITEASGLAASQCQKDVLWTVNDSGGGPLVYAMQASGESLGTSRVPNVRNTDWEDIAGYRDASGKCFLYIAEIGDNKQQRDERAVYRIPEPGITADSKRSDKAQPLESGPAGIARFSYPDYRQNAETLLVHPVTGEMYVITKRITGPAGVYRITSKFGGENEPAVSVAEISVPAIPNGLLTGGGISPDGRRVIICDYTAAYEFTVEPDAPFDAIWKASPVTVDVGQRDTGEAISYTADGTALVSTSEGRKAPIYEMRLKK